MGVVRFLLALSVAGLLFWSGVAKLLDPLKLALAIRAFQLGIPDEIAHWSAFAVPWAELVAGVCILLPKTRMAAAWLTAFLMGVFMVGIVSLLVRGMDVDCPCFVVLVPLRRSARRLPPSAQRFDRRGRSFRRKIGSGVGFLERLSASIHFIPCASQPLISPGDMEDVLLRQVRADKA